MRLEFIERVREGDVLGKNVMSSEGNILLRAGIKINNNYIDKLKSLGVYYLYISDERLDDIGEVDEEFEKLKSKTLENMGEVIKNLNNGNKRRVRESLKCVEELVDYIIEIKDVRNSLNDIQAYDKYTYYHSLDTGILAAFLGVNLKYTRDELKKLAVGAILHDVGKIKIPSSIIKKRGKLTESEYKEVKKHPIYGAEMLKNVLGKPQPIIKSVLEHHERVDGKGYPFGLKGDKISSFGKVVSICDVYNAVNSDRSYRKRFKPNEAYELILAGCGTAFDEDIVRRFKKTFAVYPMGSCVKLSNGIEGYVISQNENFPDRPVLRVLYDSQTRKPIKFYEINLINMPNVTVECVK